MEGQADVLHTMREVCGNTSVMLLTAVTLATSGKGNRRQGQEWLHKFLEHFAPNGTLQICIPANDGDEGQDPVEVTLTLDRGKVSLADVAAACRGRKSNTRGLRLQSQQNLSTLLSAIRLRSDWSWLLKQLLLQVSMLVEKNLDFVNFAEGEASMGYGFHRDPVQRVSNVRVAQQKAWRTKRQNKLKDQATQCQSQPARLSKEARAKARARVAVARQMLTRRDKQRERSLYFQECQCQFRNAKQLAVAFDASRVGGRKLTSFAMMNLQSGVSAWAPSQAGSWVLPWGRSCQGRKSRSMSRTNVITISCKINESSSVTAQERFRQQCHFETCVFGVSIEVAARATEPFIKCAFSVSFEAQRPPQHIAQVHQDSGHRVAGTEPAPEESALLDKQVAKLLCDLASFE